MSKKVFLSISLSKKKKKKGQTEVSQIQAPLKVKLNSELTIRKHVLHIWKSPCKRRIYIIISRYIYAKSKLNDLGSEPNRLNLRGLKL